MNQSSCSNTDDSKLDSILPIPQSDDDDLTKSTLLSVIINALNIIAGVSFLGLPFALKQSGVVIGLFILVTLCYLTGMDEFARL